MRLYQNWTDPIKWLLHIEGPHKKVSERKVLAFEATEDEDAQQIMNVCHADECSLWYYEDGFSCDLFWSDTLHDDNNIWLACRYIGDKYSLLRWEAWLDTLDVEDPPTFSIPVASYYFNEGGDQAYTRTSLSHKELKLILDMSSTLRDAESAARILLSAKELPAKHHGPCKELLWTLTTTPKHK